MGLEGRFTGMKAANGIAMMFGIHSGEKISGGFVLGLGLLAAPMHAETVAEAAEHSDHAHGAGLPHAALIIPMGDIQPQVQPVFDAPGRSVVLQPLGRVEFFEPQACHQRHGFGTMMTQISAQEGDLFDARKVHLFGRRRYGTQRACFELALVELTAARPGGRGVLREKKSPAEAERASQCWLGR